MNDTRYIREQNKTSMKSNKRKSFLFKWGGVKDQHYLKIKNIIPYVTLDFQFFAISCQVGRVFASCREDFVEKQKQLHLQVFTNLSNCFLEHGYFLCFREPNLAATLAWQPTAGHSLSFYYYCCFRTLSWGLLVGPVAESCGRIWLPRPVPYEHLIVTRDILCLIYVSFVTYSNLHVKVYYMSLKD